MSWFGYFSRRAVLMLIVLPMVCNVCARSWYCLTYDDFMADKWIEIPEVTLDARTEGTKFWLGGSDYNLEVGDDEIDQMLKKHSRMLNSRQPVDYLYGNLERHKGKLHPEQITIPGVKSDADEVKEIDIFVEAMRDPKWFFDEPHHVGCRKLFDTEEESNV